jgi:hypothetical protein
VSEGESKEASPNVSEGEFVNANRHFHTLAPDCVWHELPDVTVTFHPLPPPPTDAEVELIAARVVRRTARLVAAAAMFTGGVALVIRSKKREIKKSRKQTAAKQPKLLTTDELANVGGGQNGIVDIINA